MKKKNHLIITTRREPRSTLRPPPVPSPPPVVRRLQPGEESSFSVRWRAAVRPHISLAHTSSKKTLINNPDTASKKQPGRDLDTPRRALFIFIVYLKVDFYKYARILQRQCSVYSGELTHRACIQAFFRFGRKHEASRFHSVNKETNLAFCEE